MTQSQAALVGSYTPNANTLYLVHFDESAGASMATNIGWKGGRFITITNTMSGNGLALPPVVTTLLGQPSYAGFTNAITCTNVDGLADGYAGFDGNGNGVYDADVQGAASGSPDGIVMTNLNIGNGGASPFTIEANIFVTATNGNMQEIVCSDSYHQRGFQFKITNVGQLQFQYITAPTCNLTVPIPTSGPNGYVPNNWYHVAITYDGSTLRLYWTRLDPSVSADNLIGTTTWASTAANGAVIAPLVIGGENRGSDQESFRGLVDEVRISNVALGAGQMQFYSTAITISQNPASQNIDYTQPVTFSVAASSALPIAYQWRFNGTPIDGATNTSYSISSAGSVNAGAYDVVMTNSIGFVTNSTVATLVVGAGNYLTHRWSFAADTTDSIGGATGTNYGNATVSGGSLVLDGTTGTYMGLPMHLLTGLTAVTFDFWAQFGANGNDAHVFDFGNTNFIYLGTGGYPENYVYYSPHTGSGNNTLGASAGSFEFEQGVTGTGTFDNQTMHITCVIDPPDQFMGIYTNGVLEASITNFGVSLASIDDQQCWIGRALFSNLRNYAYLNASINELRIYSGALSPGSVVQSDFAGPNGFLPSGPVQLVSQPSSQAVLVGETVTFSGLAGGEPPISYQWYENGTAIPNATNTTYSFVAASGQNGDTFALAAANNVGGTNYTATSTNAILTVVSNPQTLTWLGANGNAWDTSTLNWSNANTASIVAFGPFDGALFDNHGSAQPNVNLVQPLNPLVVTVDSTANYTLSSTAGNGSLVGNGELVKNNTGTLVIDVTNLMTGPVTISGGTVQIGNNDTLGAIGSPVTNNASLVLARSDATSLPGPISGTGSVTVNAGTVSAAGTNSYTGASTINGGIVTMATSAALGATNGAITVANGGELYITGNFDEGLKPLVLAGSGVANGGALRKGGAGVTGYYGPVTLTADATLNVDGGATLNLTNSAPLDGAGANANLTLAGSGAGNIVGSISLGTGNLTVSGGTWTVAASNNYSGLTTISGGSLLIPSRQSLGPVPGAFNSAEISLVGGTLGVTTNVALNDGNAGITVGNGTVLNGGLSVAAGSTLILSNDISGSGSAVLTKSGPGTLILQAANDFSGTLNIDGNSTSANDGSTVIANNAAIANLLALQGFPAIYIRNNNSGSSTLALDGTAGALNIAPDISMAGRNVAVPEIENLIGDNTISGSFELQVGGSYYLQSDSGTLTLSAPLPYSSPGGSRQLIFTGAGTILPAGAIQDGTTPGGTNGFVAILKTGTGRLLLTTANTYSGATGISNGVVVLSGSIASTNAVLVNGGLLVSAGSIAGPVNVGAAGSVEAGTTNTIGVFTLGGGALTLHGNTIVKINKGTSANDSFTGQGVVTYGGTLTVTNLSGTLTTNDTFTLFSPGTSTSNFSSIVGSPGTGLAYSFTNGVLRIVNGIATNPTNILFSVSGNTLTLSWPADHQGWILQAQTNSLSSGLGTNWVDVPNSASITSTNIVIVPQNASVFYRLRSPN